MPTAAKKSICDSTRMPAWKPANSSTARVRAGPCQTGENASIQPHHSRPRMAAVIAWSRPGQASRAVPAAALQVALPRNSSRAVKSVVHAAPSLYSALKG